MNDKVISVKDLTFTYAGSASPAFSGINLELKKGEFITITGSSGCGKSTLALCLAGFIPHHIAGEMQGSVIINGMDTREYSPTKLAGSIGLVQQDPEAQLCTLKVMDEVAFGPENLCLPREEIRTRVNRALKAVDALHLKEREVYSLSGGEKQRVAIAAILAMEPAVIILDEPTANLDPVGTEQVLQAIINVKNESKSSIIVIEHRLKRILPVSDRLIDMSQGDGSLTQKVSPKMRVSQGTVPLTHSAVTPALRVEKLGLSYGAKAVLKDINFKIYPGEITAVMGSNGCGKTSLILSLLGINKIDKGNIFLDEKKITGKKVSWRARKMGLVFQNPNHQIFENTVWREASLPSQFLLKDGVDNTGDLDALLSEFELSQYKDTLPFTLSLGEKKRLTLVSVLGYNPDILLLDEPLIGQDNYRSDLFWQAVLKHREQGGTTIMVCHEPDFVETFCDRILFLHDGNLVIDSPTAEAFKLLEEYGFHQFLPA